MMKITGLDKMTRDLENAQKALGALDGDLGTVKFNPTDPGSIEAAIQEVNLIVDERLGAYASNPIVKQLADQIKQKYREAILEKAAAARLMGNQE